MENLPLAVLLRQIAHIDGSTHAGWRSRSQLVEGPRDALAARHARASTGGMNRCKAKDAARKNFLSQES
jgi:hypothetical protein